MFHKKPSLFKAKPQPKIPPKAQQLAEEKRSAEAEKKIIEDAINEMTAKMRKATLEKYTSGIPIDESIYAGPPPSSTSGPVEKSSSKTDIDTPEDIAALKNRPPYDFKTELFAPTMMSDDHSAKPEYEDSRWRMQFSRVFDHLEWPKEAVGEAFVAYVDARLNERKYFNPEGLRYLAQDLKGARAKFTTIAISNKWVIGLEGEKLLVGEIIDPRQHVEMKETKVTIPNGQCFANVCDDNLAISDMTGRSMICLLPNCFDENNIPLSTARVDWKKKPVSMVSCFAMNRLYVAALTSEKSLYVYSYANKRIMSIYDVRKDKHVLPCVSGVSCSISGHKIFIGGADGNVYTFHLLTREEGSLPGSFSVDAKAVAAKVNKDEKEVKQKQKVDSKSESGSGSGNGASAMNTERDYHEDKYKEEEFRTIMLMLARGLRIFAANKFEVRMWDFGGIKLRAQSFPVNNVVGMALSGNLLVVHQMSGTTLMIDLAHTSTDKLDYARHIRLRRVECAGLHFDNIAINSQFIVQMSSNGNVDFAKIKDEADRLHDREEQKASEEFDDKLAAAQNQTRAERDAEVKAMMEEEAKSKIVAEAIALEQSKLRKDSLKFHFEADAITVLPVLTSNESKSFEVNLPLSDSKNQIHPEDVDMQVHKV